MDLKCKPERTKRLAAKHFHHPLHFLGNVNHWLLMLIVSFLDFREAVGRMPPDPPIGFSTLRGSSYKRSVPMLCPSNGNVLATPLAQSY